MNVNLFLGGVYGSPRIMYSFFQQKLNRQLIAKPSSFGVKMQTGFFFYLSKILKSESETLGKGAHTVMRCKYSMLGKGNLEYTGIS